MPRTFGENLRRIRKSRRLTQEELAERLGLKGTTPVSLWESRAAIPRPETVVRIAQALACQPSELLQGVETPYDRLRAGKSLDGSRRRSRLEPPTARTRRAG
jgi:transcriptional regulator with XRE-family HTH domain